MADGYYGAGHYGLGLYGFGEITGSAVTDPNLLAFMADPYNWMVALNTLGWLGQRRQEGAMILLNGTTQAELATKISAYEAYAVARGVPVSHEWGQLFGSTADRRAGLVKR